MTIEDLLTYLRKQNVSERYYSLNGVLKDDAIILRESKIGWEVFYFERGYQYDVSFFRNIEDALIYIQKWVDKSIRICGNRAFHEK